MKLLVTGGAGFIGSNFIRYWFDQYPDDKIINLDALTYAGNLENLTDIADQPGYTFVKGSVLDEDLIDELVSQVDLVVHFAAESHVDRSILGPDQFIKTNINGTYVMLEAARRHQVKFHHISTDEVFGSLELGSDKKFDIQSCYDPRSPYSASKAASDHLVRAYHHTFGLDTTISNCSNNYGPYQFPEKFIALAITNALEDKPIPIYGKGNQVRDWLYVADHCRAIDLIINQAKPGETYLIGGMTEDITNLQVAEMILSILDKPDSLIEYVKDRAGHDVRYAVDWSRAEQELGYRPENDFQESLKHTIEWYQRNQDWWKRVKSGEYQTYYTAQYKDRK